MAKEKFVNDAGLAIYDGLIKNEIDKQTHTHNNKTILDNTTASFTTEEKTKLSNVASGAEVNQNAFGNVKVGSTTIVADSKTDTLEIEAGSNVTITPDATNDKITISSAHPTITKSTDSASTSSPAHGGTITMIDSVTRDMNGHVTKINTKTVTLPSITGAASTITNDNLEASHVVVTDDSGKITVSSRINIIELDCLDGVTSNVQTQFNNKADKKNTDGGFEGGLGASAGYGGAVGNAAEADDGGAVGDCAKTGSGGAIGAGAIASRGFSGGYNAIAADSEGRGIDAIQLGTGTNSNEKTLQVYDYQLMDADGNIPVERLSVSTNDQTPTYTKATTVAELTSGEKLSTAFGKISKAISEFIKHNTRTPGDGNLGHVRLTHDPTYMVEDGSEEYTAASGMCANILYQSIADNKAELATIKEKLAFEKITTVTDFNTLQTSGIYHIAVGSCPNTPVQNWGTLFVDFDTGTPYQLYIPDGENRVVYKRGYLSSVWKPWKKVGGTSGYTLIFAASNSSAADKEKADIVLTGDDDRTEIMNVITALSSGANATLYFCAGTYNFEINSVWSNVNWGGVGRYIGIYAGVGNRVSKISGAGKGTIFNISSNVTDNAIYGIYTDYGVIVENIQLTSNVLTLAGSSSICLLDLENYSKGNNIFFNAPYTSNVVRHFILGKYSSLNNSININEEDATSGTNINISSAVYANSTLNNFTSLTSPTKIIIYGNNGKIANCSNIEVSIGTLGNNSMVTNNMHCKVADSSTGSVVNNNIE